MSEKSLKIEKVSNSINFSNTLSSCEKRTSRYKLATILVAGSLILTVFVALMWPPLPVPCTRREITLKFDSTLAIKVWNGSELMYESNGTNMNATHFCINYLVMTKANFEELVALNATEIMEIFTGTEGAIENYQSQSFIFQRGEKQGFDAVYYNLTGMNSTSDLISNPDVILIPMVTCHRFELLVGGIVQTVVFYTWLLQDPAVFPIETRGGKGFTQYAIKGLIGINCTSLLLSIEQVNIDISVSPMVGNVTYSTFDEQFTSTNVTINSGFCSSEII